MSWTCDGGAAVQWGTLVLLLLQVCGEERVVSVTSIMRTRKYVGRICKTLDLNQLFSG